MKLKKRWVPVLAAVSLTLGVVGQAQAYYLPEF